MTNIFRILIDNPNNKNKLFCDLLMFMHLNDGLCVIKWMLNI